MNAHAERRRHPRIARVAWLNAVQARIRPGHDVLVIDLSHGGALVETSRRLAPGTCVDLLLEATDARHTTRVSVVRSYVCALGPGQVLFRTALLFDRPVPWLKDTAPVANRAAQSFDGISAASRTTREVTVRGPKSATASTSS